MRDHTLTTTVLPLYVRLLRNSSEAASYQVTDRQPLRRCPLRRCPRLRIWIRHHIDRCSFRILRSEDRTISFGQENSQRGRFPARCLVGPCQQAHGSLGMCRAGHPRRLHPYSVRFSHLFRFRSAGCTRGKVDGEVEEGSIISPPISSR